MDELTLLRQFRADVPRSLRAGEQARVRLERMIEGRRQQRPRRLLVLLASIVLLIALGGTAYGLAREFLLGDPAPDPVKEQAAMLSEVKGELIPKARVDPGIRVEETKLAAFLDASTGPVYLWVAPSERSGLCLFMQIVGTELPNGRPNLGGGCGSGGRTIDWGISGSRVRDGRLLALLSGSVSDKVARLELTSNGKTVSVPLQERFFLVELPGGGDRPTPEIPVIELVAYDASGQELARQKSRPPFNTPGRPSGPPEQPTAIDLNGQLPLIEIKTRRTGKPIQLYVLDHVPERDGQRCTVLISPGGTGTGCGGRPIGQSEVAVHPNQIGSAPRGMLLLWGEVGSQIARLELRFEDGRVESLPLARQFALYQVDPADFVAGRRPLKLVGQDATGKVVGERKLGPWRP